MAEKHWADHGDVDSDRDGMSDEFERQVVGTNPYDADSDDDGLNDYRERDFGTNPLAYDSDNDGLSDGREVTIGTNPHHWDTDGDRVSDHDEVRADTASAPDGDRDGTPDWVEAVRDRTYDSDGDGLYDGEEAWLRTNRYSEHSDHDGQGDFWEVAVGTDPRTGGNDPRFPSVPDRPYQGGTPDIPVDPNAPPPTDLEIY